MLSVVTGNSAVDRFRAGDASALPLAVQRGQRLFLGKARCAGCHSGGNYTDEQFHRSVLGSTVSDLGRGAVTGRAVDRKTFKTPSLRNIALTAPYFHAGQVQTLAEVIQLYNQGSDESTLRDPELHPLNLSEAEQDDMLTFLQALNGEIRNVEPPQSFPSEPAYECAAPGVLYRGAYGSGCPSYTCWALKPSAAQEGMVDGSPYGYPEWDV